MIFNHIYDPDLAQASYLIACQATGEAIIIDARRDIQIYLDELSKNKLKLVAVTETHIHADYLSGSRDLAEATGASLYLSGEGGQDWAYRFGHNKLHDGDILSLGKLRIKAVHTPGHTPEHLSFLITDAARTDKAGFYLTGDFVFVGDLGRPDLLDEVAEGDATRFLAAQQMFASLKNKFLSLPDYVQVWPGHGAGSACGKDLGAVASTTVGYERQTAWWASFVESNDEQGFTKTLLADQPDAPRYFKRMKLQNKMGPPRLPQGNLTLMSPAELQSRSHELVLLDTRPASSYVGAAVKGSINVPYGKNFATFAPYVLNPEQDFREIVLLAKDEAEAKSMRDKLSYVGIDKVKAYLTSLKGLETSPVKMLAADELAAIDKALILDLRTNREFKAGHIPKALHIHAGAVMWNLEHLPKDQPIVAYCQSGTRSSVVASALRARGFASLFELKGGYQVWEKTLQAIP